MKRHRRDEGPDPNAKAAEETKQHFERLYAAFRSEAEFVEPEPEPKPMMGRPRFQQRAAGIYLLLWPTWERICRRLPKIPGGPEFLRLSAEEQRAVFKKLARVASMRSRYKDARLRSCQNDARRWRSECADRFPTVTPFALKRLRKRVRAIKRRGPGYWLPALGYVPEKTTEKPKARRAVSDVRKAAMRFEPGAPVIEEASPRILHLLVHRSIAKKPGGN